MYNHALFTTKITVNLPVRVRVMLMGLSWSLHVTTVPFNMASRVAVTLRVDVRSDRGGVKVRVVVKMPRFLISPTRSFTKNVTGLLNAVLLHSRLVAPPVTVHVSIASSPGHMPPRALEVNVTTPSEYQHSTIQRICHVYALCVHDCGGWGKIIVGHYPLYSNATV